MFTKIYKKKFQMNRPKSISQQLICHTMDNMAGNTLAEVEVEAVEGRY